MKRVALVAVFREDGRLLLGKRRDNGKWTMVAGHVEDGEDPAKGALREMLEECGLKPTEFEQLDERAYGGKTFHVYRAKVADGAKPTCENDPDEEVLFWRWVDVSGGVPKDIAENCAGPKDEEENVLFRLYGIKKSERHHEPDLEDLAKAEEPAAESTAAAGTPTFVLVRHGATDFNSGTAQEPTERLRGWLDVPLNEQGRQEGRQAGRHLRGHPIQAIFASDLDRTLETARLVDEESGAGVRIQPAPQLRPWHLGQMHGQPLPKVLPQMIYYLEHEDQTPPGGEPFVNFHRRAIGYLMRLLELARANPQAGAVVAVSHSREARLLKGWVQGGCRADGAIDKSPILSKEEAAKTGHLLVLKFEGGSWLLTDERGIKEHRGEDSPRHNQGAPDRRPLGKAGESWLKAPPEHEEDRYCNGFCDALAVAMNRRHGWPIEVAHWGDPGRNNFNLSHAWAVMPDGRAVDVLGARPREDMLRMHHVGGAKLRRFPDEASYDKFLHEHGEMPYGQDTYESAGRLADRFPGLHKREEDDEVDRLLLHQNPAERRMALKLGGVKPRHLVRALAGDDPEVHELALAHPALDHGTLLALMQMPGREHLQLRALRHPLTDRSHAEALWHAHRHRPLAEKRDVLHAVGQHPALDAGLIEKMVEAGEGHGVVENLKTPEHVLRRLVEDHFLDPRHDQKRALARRALKHPSLPPGLAERAFREGSADVRMAVAQGPHLPESLAQDALQRGLLPAGDGEALLRSFIVQNPKSTKRHLETASRDRNPVVAHAARSRLGLLKFEGSRSAWLGEQLLKATHAPDYAVVVQALDPAGRDLVDHKPDLSAHPPQHGHDVQAYRQHVLESPEPVQRSRNGAKRGSGVTRKLVYQLPATHATHAGVRYMVKPYHERVVRRIQAWGKRPHQGWAEMTNQALYHAAGIGHLHQAVHVSEHRMSPDLPAEPALVVRMDPGYQMVAELAHPRHQVSEETRADARKVALMDFLTNNLDRHHGNLLVKTNAEPVWDRDKRDWVPETVPRGAPIQSSLLAIDHSRSFQYQNVPQYKRAKRRAQPDELHDAFGHYIRDPSSTFGSPLTGVGELAHIGPQWDRMSDPYQSIHDFEPTFEWWEQASPGVRAAFDKRLEQVRDPGVRAHLKRNFDERARWLDQVSHFGVANFGRDWYNSPVRLYRPGELTDDEREERARDLRLELEG